MTTESQFAVYARIIKDSTPPTWMLSGHNEWRIEKALRFGYMLALFDITGREFDVKDSLITSIEKEHQELTERRAL